MSELRRNRIFDLLRISGRVVVPDIARELGISGETVRRDLKKMAEDGLVEIVRGGAALPDVLREAAFQHCLNLNADLKRRIATAAAALVRNGDAIMIGGGSTTSYFALALREHRNLRIITNSVDAARILGSRGENEVHAIGGRLDSPLGSTVGIVAVENVGRYTAQKAFFSVGGVDISGGLTCDTADEAACWSAMIANSSEAIVLVDSTKFRKHCVFRCAAIGELDAFVSDGMPDPELAACLARNGVRFVHAGDDAPSSNLPSNQISNMNEPLHAAQNA